MPANISDVVVEILEERGIGWAHSRAGLDVRVTRIYDGIGVHNRKHSCSWCLSRCGTDMPYDTAYEKGAFQRHPGCHCELFYKTSKGVQRQAAWQNNKWEGTQRPLVLEMRQRYGATGETVSPSKNIQAAQTGRLFRNAHFKSPIDKSEYLDTVWNTTTDTNITSSEAAYVRRNIHQISGKNIIGRVITLSSMSKIQYSLSYDRIYAINSDLDVIVKLTKHGFAALSGKKKKAGAYIIIADFAASFTQFDPYGTFKKVSNDVEVSAEVIENVKYTLAHAAGTYGVLHPGLRIDGIE